MKDLSNNWSLFHLFICSSVAVTSVVLMIYGIYHFAVTFLPQLTVAVGAGS